ncbi:MAG: hypothetical protein WA705_09675 [Candidatus Ozemobacteraceae bacterium]
MHIIRFAPTRIAALLACLFMLVSTLLEAQPQLQSPSMSQVEERGQALDKVILSLWLEGASDKTLTDLQQLATGTHNRIWGKASFHLACAQLMKGNRSEAGSRLKELEAEAGNPEIAVFIAPLKNLLFPQPGKDGQMSIDIQELTIDEIIRMVAAQANRAVIIDSGIDLKRISLHLPTANFDQVMKILAELGNFDSKMIGEILLVTPKEKTINAGTSAEGKLSLDLRDVDVRDALRLVAIKGKTNLVFHKNVKGFITIHLQDVAPIEALRLITRSADLFLEKDGDNYLVMNISEKEKLTGKSDVLTIPLKYLDGKDALILLRGINLSSAEEVKDGNGLWIKGSPEALDKARELLLSQDKPQQPILISIKIWEILKNNGIKSEEFSKLSDEQKKELAHLLSSPRIITVPGRMASIGIGSSDKPNEKAAEKVNDKDTLDLKLDILPINMGEGLIRLEMKCKVRVFSDASGQKKETLREFSSTFVAKMDSPFVYEVQGGSIPTLMEILISKAQQ